jgi:glycosyltransferase 2 family protein
VSLSPAGPEPAASAPEPARAPSWRRALRAAYGTALVVAAIAVLIARWDEIGDLVSGARLLPLVGALGLGLVSLWQSAWFWSRCLTHLGAPQPVGRVLEATVAAVPARYLPGSVWFAFGRVGHLRRAGTPGVALGLVAVLETLLSFVVAVGLAGGLLLVAGREDGDIGLPVLVAGAIALALVASPWVVNPVVRWVVARRRLGTPPTLGWRAYLELCAHLVGFWAASAAAFLCYLSAFPAVVAPGAVRTAGTFLLSWAAGFVAVFAPQGAGVFETTLAGLLDGPVAALALVIGGYRALTAIRDVTALAGLAVVRTFSARPSRRGSPRRSS